MAWNVLATARHFNSTPEARKYLIDCGANILETEYGGSLNDAELQGEKLKHMLDGVDAIICGAVKMTRDVILSSNKLRSISRRGVGFDMVDIEAATEKRIVVTITPGTIEPGVADHVFALILAVAKKILDSHNCVRNEEWQAFMGMEIYKKNLGIIGLGRIGKGVARRGVGFEMNLLAYDNYQDDDFAKEFGVKYVTLEKLLCDSDIVCICAPLNKNTYHLIGKEQLNLMKPSSILINTSRGGLIDEIELTKCLKEKRIYGAGLDVFEHEPLGKSAFNELGSVVLTPHCAGYTVESIARANLMAAKNVIDILEGKLPDMRDAIVNPRAMK